MITHSSLQYQYIFESPLITAEQELKELQNEIQDVNIELVEKQEDIKLADEKRGIFLEEMASLNARISNINEEILNLKDSKLANIEKILEEKQKYQQRNCLLREELGKWEEEIYELTVLKNSILSKNNSIIYLKNEELNEQRDEIRKQYEEEEEKLLSFKNVLEEVNTAIESKQRELTNTVSIIKQELSNK